MHQQHKSATQQKLNSSTIALVNKKYLQNKKAWQKLYAQENFLFIHEIEECPLYHYITNSECNIVPWIADKSAKPAKECIGTVFPVDELPTHVNEYGVHTDYAEKESPLFVAKYIYYIIKD